MIRSNSVSEARALLADPQVQLANALISADPLHNKADTVRVILDKGGDYLIGTKENTSQRLAAAQQTLQSQRKYSSKLLHQRAFQNLIFIHIHYTRILFLVSRN